jgi:hypothetical protein
VTDGYVDIQHVLVHTAKRRDTFLEGSCLSYRQLILFYILLFSRVDEVILPVSVGHKSQNDGHMSSYLRKVCENALLSHPVVIRGPNIIVEVDKSLFSR